MDDPSFHILTEVKGLELLFDYVRASFEAEDAEAEDKDNALTAEENAIKIRYKVGQLLTEAYEGSFDDEVPENVKELLCNWCNYVDTNTDHEFNMYQLVDFIPADLTGAYLVVILANRIT